MSSSVSNLQLLNNTEHRVKFKTGSDINNALIQPTTTHALSFNGTDQHGIISNLEINGAFTISMWIKLTDYQSSVSVYPLFLKDYVSTDTTDIFLDIGNANLRASVYDRTGPWSTQISCQMAWPPNILPNNTWHHVMMTYDGTTNSSAIKTFINGVESIINVIRDISNESSFNSVNSPADTDAYIGWGNLNNRRFKGEMDQIAIWNSDQSANISSIYTGNTPADLTSLNPDHLFELNNNTNNSTGASTLSLHSGGAGNSDPHFSKIDLPAKAKDPLVGEMLLETSRPALYSCTDTSGTISKVTDLTAKIGDVPMLKANANVFTPTSSVSSSGAGFSYSFWFYDDGTETGSQTIFKNNTTHNSHVVVNHDSSIIQFNKHAHSSNIIINNSSIASAITHGYELTYEKNKLNNFLFTKQGADPYFTKLYLNGELVASSDQNVAYYPGALFNEINPKMTNGEEMEFSLLLGDVAYWDADVSDIFDAVYSPNQGHKGYQGDWRNLTVPPKHYWKLGFPLEDGQVKDIGTDGTNHLTTRQPLEETYTTSVYSNDSYLFQPQDGVMHGMSNGQANPYDPEMFMFVGDTINITRPDSSHPLHIKDSSGNDVAVPLPPYSLSLDGTDDYMSLGNISSLSSASAFTLSTWVKTSTTNKYIYSSYASGITDSIQMYFHSGGTLRCIVGTGSSWYQIETSSTTLADGTWKNFTFVFSGGNYLKIYVNGSEETTSFVNGTNTVPTTTEANAGNTPRIADYVASGYTLDGLVDEVALFNSALLASDITSIYNSGAPGDISSLNPVGWWRMGDNNSGSGTTITDQGSGGNDGTLVGGPTFSTDVPASYITTTFSPTTAGTYQYYCTSHSSMIGNINVLQRAGYKNIFGIDRSTES